MCIWLLLLKWIAWYKMDKCWNLPMNALTLSYFWEFLYLNHHVNMENLFNQSNFYSSHKQQVKSYHTMDTGFLLVCFKKRSMWHNQILLKVKWSCYPQGRFSGIFWNDLIKNSSAVSETCHKCGVEFSTCTFKITCTKALFHFKQYSIPNGFSQWINIHVTAGQLHLE